MTAFFLHGDRSCIVLVGQIDADCATLIDPGRSPRRQRNSSRRSRSSSRIRCAIVDAGGMTAQPPSSGHQNEGLLSALSKQVDALCGAYTEKMRQLHSMLDVEEDSRERTARQTAAGRALWNHVIHDPLARFLAGESQLRKLQGKMEEAGGGACGGTREMAGVMLAVRTLWFDGKIEQALHQWRQRCPADHAPPQVVLLGAGMDARAYRLKCLEGCAVFEVDLPKIVAFKSALLKCTSATDMMEAHCPSVQDTEESEPTPQLYAGSLERVAADLTGEEWWDKLREAGFNASKSDEQSRAPTIWVLEGLLYYLKDTEARALLRRISSSCAVDTLVLADFMNEFSTHLSTELQTQFYFHSDWPEELLPTLGYVQVRVSQMGDPDANFGLISDNPLSLFHSLRHTPRYCKLGPDGSPCRRLFLVQCSVG